MEKTVLVVDDQPEIRRLVRFALKSRYAVKEAANSAEAYEMIGAEMPDVVILDVMMPGTMDGFHLCEKLRHDDGLWCLPIIILTGLTQEANHSTGVRAGTDIYMTKPFHLGELRSAVDSLLLE